MNFLKILLKSVALTIVVTAFASEQNLPQIKLTSLQRLSLEAAQMTQIDFFEKMRQIVNSGDIELDGNILQPSPLTIINRQLMVEPGNATLLFAQRLLSDLQQGNLPVDFNITSKPLERKTPRKPSRFTQAMGTIQEE